MSNRLIKFLIRFIPDRIFIPLYYFYIRREILRMKNPKTFSEKIQWLKLYGGLDKYYKYVDKYLVRDYVKNVVGEDYLIPLLGMWDRFEEIPFKKLPEKYVIKATHGSGYNFICHNNSTVDKISLKKTISSWLRENFYNLERETQYKNCSAKIICEKYLEDDSGQLRDYKFFCFNGKAKFIQVHFDRFSKNHTSDLFDISWNKLPVTLHYQNSNKHLNKPKILQEMVEIAEKLSNKFLFVRVDLYMVKEKAYFGELTFTPGNGLEHFVPNEFDYKLGDLIDLSKKLVDNNSI